MFRENVLKRSLRRLRLAIWLAWNALRGRSVEIEVGDLYGSTRFVGVRAKNEK